MTILEEIKLSKPPQHDRLTRYIERERLRLIERPRIWSEFSPAEIKHAVCVLTRWLGVFGDYQSNPLDPEPFESSSGIRMESEGWYEWPFNPRPGYEQDRSKYA